MKVKIVEVYNKGNANEEYVFLQALEDVNIGNYAIVDRTFDEDGNPSNVFRHFYRFPSKNVKAGQYISLWTKKGTDVFGKTKDGDPVHRFFWGSDAAVWNDAEIDSAELLYVSTVDKKTVGKPKKKTLKRPNDLSSFFK